MRVAFKIACRVIGVLNLGFCVFGTAFLLTGVAFTISGDLIHTKVLQKHHWSQFAGIAYAMGSVLGILLLSALLLSAIELIRLRRSAVRSYCAVTGVCLLGWFAGEALAFAPGTFTYLYALMAMKDVGLSFFYFPPTLDWYILWKLPVYPILSALLLFLMQTQANSLDRASVGIPL
jgi:hypothetical protein